MTQIQLKGMTWKHERGVAPLVAASRLFNERHPEVTIEWEARSLQDFEAYPLELLAATYDLIMIDHPHLGSAVAGDLLVPLDELLPAAFLDEQRANSVGLSHDSYFWQGHQWALAVDAAAQVATYRADLLAKVGQQPPTTWNETLRLAKTLPAGLTIGLPLVAVHAYASFFTLITQLGGTTYWSDGSPLDAEVGDQALALLQRLLPHLHPESPHSDPIAMSEHMARTDEIAYVPLMYGYSNYARDGFAPHALRYADIPSVDGEPRGSMIGGVGLAVSARTRHRDVCGEFAMMTAAPAFQRTTFFASGGQPGHRGAWLDAEVNRVSNGFFADTLRTLDLGSMRPRFAGYIDFQEQAGARIRQFLLDGGEDRKALVAELNDLLRTCCTIPD
ncbi:ABC transporter substrate-binding protein [Paenibacillus cymbidii]|uniref:ABC transporter substrate-binding protein n=1 Tax=Paenibacillus cymbidii TaxID=1639034 RepID=UPI00108141F5|nr:extracellular solute-binding protein [Paenibacillus cymbidii]